MGCGASARRYEGIKDENLTETGYGGEMEKMSTATTNGHSVVMGSDVFEQALRFCVDVPLFHSVHKADLPLLVKCMVEETFKPGSDVISQGELNDRLFIVFSGQAEVIRTEQAEDGLAEHVLLVLDPGDYFGEQELIHAEKSRATVRVKGSEVLDTYSLSHSSVKVLGMEDTLCLPKRRAMVHYDEQVALTKRTSTLALKEEDERNLIANALRSNVGLNSFCNLTAGIIERLIHFAVRVAVSAGDVVLQQGEIYEGHFYIVDSGVFSCFAAKTARNALPGRSKLSTHGKRITRGMSFGEIELMNTSVPSAATITAEENSSYWRVSHTDFMSALHCPLEERIDGYMNMLRKVAFFKSLLKEELYVLARALTEEIVDRDEDICSQGEDGNTCFLMVEGSVSVLKDGVECDRFVSEPSSSKVHSFCEEEILERVVFKATVRVTSEYARFLIFDKETFELLLGPMSQILQSDKDGKHLAPIINDSQQQFAQGKRLYTRGVDCPKLTKDDIDILGHLGHGDFGSVDLAQNTTTGAQYALKRFWRCELIDDWHQKQIVREKDVFCVMDSPFIVRLHGTLRDAKVLAMLLDFCPGGTLHSLMRKQRLYGEDDFVRFYMAGVVLAIEHMHARHIVHRDINSDNVLIDAKGWPKISDFFFAKMCVGKCFTVTSVPAFMPPEMLMQEGYDLSVDWWALGVLLYELMDGQTPFERAGDGNFLEMCRAIQTGIPDVQSWVWPSDFEEPLARIISSLLQPSPCKRLPMKASGTKKLKNLAWFKDIKWAQYEQRALKAPHQPPVKKFDGIEQSPHLMEWLTACPAQTVWDASF